MKDWPEDGKTVDFSEMADSVVDAIRFAYTLERKNDGQAIPWDGLNIGERDLATCFDPETALSAENLQYDDEDQGRDALRVLVGIALQLGIEQGRRLFLDQHKSGIELMQLSIETVAAMCEQIFPKLDATNPRPTPAEPTTRTMPSGRRRGGDER